jgi:hypothetical protein
MKTKGVEGMKRSKKRNTQGTKGNCKEKGILSMAVEGGRAESG